MFTGIITDLGKLLSLQHSAAGDVRLRIGTAYDTRTIAMGASIAHNGICLTVIAKDDGWYEAEASPHTQRVTTLGNWQVGDTLNLERALCMGDELGGHLVTGHVDGIAHILERRAEGESIRFVVQAPADLARFIASRGSVTLDGVSLTVTDIHHTQFGLALIPHTLDVTNWGNKRVGDALNLEIDVLARYIQRFLSHSQPTPSA